MKLLKHGILLLLALCSFMWSANIILVQAIDDNEIKAVSAANQVENYELKRVLKSKKVSSEEEDNYVLYYEHKKTGAQFVCFINLDYDNLQIAYRIPSENDNGVTHALEHCLYDSIVRQPEDEIDSSFEAETSDFGFWITTYYHNGRFENIDCLLDLLKNKNFLNDENIFKRQVFNQTKSHDGLILNKGRMFIEMTQSKLSRRSVYVDKIYNHEMMGRDNKLKFEPGGMPEKIANCSHSDVCDAYNKYVNPSNSLTIIRSKHFKDVMAKLDKDYMKDYDRKDIDVDYRLPGESDFEFFSQYDVNGVTGIFEKDYNYCGIATYPLKGVKNDKINTFKNLCNAINSEAFKYYKLVDMGYGECRAELCESVDCSYLRIVIGGDDIHNFDEEVLLKSFEHILINAIDCDYSEHIEKIHGFINASCEKLMRAYAFSGDIFSDRFFTVVNNEIVNCEENPGIDKSLLKDLKPEKIALLKSNKDVSENIRCRYQVSFADNDKAMIQLAMRILNRGLVSKKLQDEGSIYVNMSTKSESNDERCCCFYSDESVAFDNITDFFKNDFNEQVKNFVVSDELFSLVKNNIINGKDLLEAVWHPDFYGNEHVVKEEIIDKTCSLRKSESKKNISSVTKEEIQDFIRTAKFVGHAIVK